MISTVQIQRHQTCMNSSAINIPTLTHTHTHRKPVINTERATADQFVNEAADGRDLAAAPLSLQMPGEIRPQHEIQASELLIFECSLDSADKIRGDNYSISRGRECVTNWGLTANVLHLLVYMNYSLSLITPVARPSRTLNRNPFIVY